MSYSKAISNVQQQLQVKSEELFHLNARLEEVGKEESLLKVELDQLSSFLAENEAVSMAEKATTSALTSGDKTSKEGEELQKLQSELDMWEKIVAKHEYEWFNLLQNSTKWPSAAQREKELERRLRILSEQYMTKQVQADAILKERNTLQFQLNQLTDASRQDFLMDTESNTYKGKTRKAVSTASNALEDFLPMESKSTPESDKPLIMIMKNGLRHASEVVSNVFSFRHSRSWQTSSQLSTSFLLRYLILLYLLMLHIVPFAVILSAT
ncbi:hypothetical protein KP509_21G000600 [Ceratopteris richardii]|nr:hypothetical protein KP509_21G000600 [Ceratopteris richardii]